MSRAQEILLASRLHEERNDYISEEDDDDEEFESGSESDDTQFKENYFEGFTKATSSNCYRDILYNLRGVKRRGRGQVGILSGLRGVLGPRTTWVRKWNKIFYLVCFIGLYLDPLFFYTLSISEAYLSLFVDGSFAAIVTVLRCMIDLLHVWNMWLQFKMANEGSTRRAVGEKSVAHKGALGYIKAKSGFFLDLFVTLPLPQIVIWVVVPYMIRRGCTTEVMTVLLIIFILQYLPKIYHIVCLLRRMQKFSGHVFGTIWWGFALNMIAYFVASHIAGACWYLLGIQRATNCLKEQCSKMYGCSAKLLAFKQPVYYRGNALIKDHDHLFWASNKDARHICLESYNDYQYGAYNWVIYVVSNNNRTEKILMSIFWGLMTMSTCGSLESTTEWLESLFVIIVLTTGLLLVTMLIGNIKKQAMQLRMEDVEWWMKNRKLPYELKQRVRSYEWQRWAAMRGVDECELIQNLPDSIRRDIKYHLCLDLVKQVPLFQHMDNLVLENIVDRVKTLIFTKGETITKEGDPVQRMLFIVRGHLQSSQYLRDGVKSCCMLGPGNFSGDELLSWCLRRPFIERLPPSSSTLISIETMEAFGLEADDVKYVTQHFRYNFVNDKFRRSARYYSPGWRFWAAVSIQLAWRRYKHRLTLTSLSFIRPRRPLSRSSSLGEDRLRLYTALLISHKPNQDDFDY